MGTGRTGLSVRYIGVFTFRRAHVVPVKIPVLKDFPELQPDCDPRRLIDGKFHPAHHILSHIQYGFPRGRMQQGRRSETLHYPDGRTEPGGEAACGKARLFHRIIGFSLPSFVINFSVVDAVKKDFSFPDRPAFVRTHDAFLSVFKEKMEFSDKRILLPMAGQLCFQPIRPFIPAFPQHGFQRMGSFRHRELIGLILQPAVIGMKAGEKNLFS